MKPGIVGEGAVKVAYIRVVPGEEANVYRSLDLACANDDGVSNYSILKSFGHNDLLVVYEVENFDFHLSEYGPIAGILSSYQSFSFPYMGTSSEQLFDCLNNKLCSGFSLIKYKNWIEEKSIILKNEEGSDYSERLILNTEKCIIDTVKNTENMFLLGSIGWNEIILINCNESIENAIKTIAKLNTGENLAGHVEKYFSFITVNYKFLPTDPKYLSDTNKSIDYLNNYPALAEKINFDEICATVSVASQPCNLSEINDWWTSTDAIEPNAVLGLYDLAYVIDESSDLTWAQLITYILSFRYEFKSRVKSTSTVFNLKKVTLSDPCPMFIPSLSAEDDNDLYVDFESKILRDVLDDDTAKLLANNIYALNSHLQNPISGRAFHPMYYFATKTVKIIEKIYKGELQHDDIPLDINTMSFHAYSLLACGCDLQSYGIFGNMERPHNGGYYRQRAGVHLAVRAIEVIPSYLLYRLGQNWDGFVSVEEPKFFHLSEVIKVPCDALWKPAEYWWAMYHETGHILLEKEFPDGNYLLKDNDAVIASLLLNRSNKEKTFTLLVELAAELFGYLVGFFHNYQLFLEVLLQYLSKLAPASLESLNLTDYLFRTFFVKLYSAIYIDESIDLKILSNKDLLYTEALKHINECQKILNEVGEYQYLFDLNSFYAVNWADTIFDLQEYFPYLKGKITELKLDLEPKINEDEISFTEDIYQGILDGNVHYGTIPCPEYLLYLFYGGRADFTSKANIAAILTFSNITDKEIVRFTS